MFEHLDDPSQEIHPGARELAMVSRRAEQISTRRRWTLMVGLCCILLAASVGFFLARPAAKRASTSSADYQFDLLKGKLPIGVSVPATALVDVGFASPQDGFALAVHRGDVLLAASTDGGTTWQVRSEDLPAGLGANDGYPGQLEFIGSTGYLWGARSAGLAPLWISHDDGATWHVAQVVGPYVIDASAIGTNVWALTSMCPATAATTTTLCSMGLEQSVDAGNTWRPLNVPALNGGVAAGSGIQAMELARITSTRAYILATTQASPTAIVHWQLSFTADSGATWTSRLVPCGGPFALGAEVAASSTDDLWLLCGSQASAGEQSKQLFRSSDGGATWSLVAAAVLGTPAQASVAPNPLPLAGYIAPFTIGHRNLAVASPETAWLFPSRADLYSTSDGGASWDQVPELVAAGFASGGEGNITFLSPTDGWICAYGVGLWQTTDGVHWHPLGTS